MWINYQFMAVCPLILIFLHISSRKWLVFTNNFGLPNFLPQLANFFTRIYPSYPWHFPTLCVCGSVCEIRWYMLVGEARTGVPTSSLDPFYNYSYVVYILDIDIDISTFRMHPYPYQQIYYGSDIYISDYEWVTTKDQCAKMSPKPFLSFTNVHISATSSLGCMHAYLCIALWIIL